MQYRDNKNEVDMAMLDFSKPFDTVLHNKLLYKLKYYGLNSNTCKATFSVHKLIPKNDQMTNVYRNWSLYITFTMIYFIKQE